MARGSKLTAEFKPFRERLKAANRYYGIYSRVARRLGISPTHVRNVALGLRTSSRVERALKVEADRIERQADAEVA